MDAARIIVAPVNSTDIALIIHISVISFPTVSRTLPPKSIAPTPIATPAMIAPFVDVSIPRPTSGPTALAELFAPPEKAINIPVNVIKTVSKALTLFSGKLEAR